MRFSWKLLMLVLLALPTMSVVGCGPTQAPPGTDGGEPNSEEDNSGSVGDESSEE